MFVKQPLALPGLLKKVYGKMKDIILGNIRRRKNSKVMILNKFTAPIMVPEYCDTFNNPKKKEVILKETGVQHCKKI